MFKSKIAEEIIGKFSSGSSLQDSVYGIRSECHRIGERKGVVGNGPEKIIKVIRLEYFLVMIRSRIAGNNSLRKFSGR